MPVLPTIEVIKARIVSFFVYFLIDFRKFQHEFGSFVFRIDDFLQILVRNALTRGELVDNAVKKREMLLIVRF